MSENFIWQSIFLRELKEPKELTEIKGLVVIVCIIYPLEMIFLDTENFYGNLSI